MDAAASPFCDGYTVPDRTGAQPDRIAVLKQKPMKNKLLILSGLLTLSLAGYAYPGNVTLIDNGWMFHRGGAQGAEAPGFNTAGWAQVDLPHDWSIEDLPETGSPFSRDAISQVSGGFTTGGTAWYRKELDLPGLLQGRILRVLFEGVYMNAEVYLNGYRLGDHPYGYTSFWFDITPYVRFGEKNILAVKVRNEGENSRWYSGSGIYRHVWMIASDPVHLDIWGTSITTPAVSDQTARVIVSSRVLQMGKKNAGVRMTVTLLNPAGAEVARRETALSVAAGDTAKIEQELEVPTPVLWDPDHPALYNARVELFADGRPCDAETIPFGIRTFSFSADQGFMLNHKPLKLKGGCFHHDNGPLGSKAYDRAEERKVELLKASGFNAVRCSHNPPSPAFLDACDRLGMLVMDEAFDMWDQEKNPADYHLYFGKWWKRDLENMVVRDRNHPSVILWSIGNEIPNRHTREVVALAGELASFVRTLDPTRPVTSAVNDLKPDKDPYFATLDVAGYNYAAGGDHGMKNLYVTDHERVPERIMVGTESYPLEAFQSWMDVVDHPWVVGDFVWTAFDYIGEASIGWRGYWQSADFFPWNLAYCGDIDICGWKRPQSFYRDALWKPGQLSLFVTPPAPSFALNKDRQSWSIWHWFDALASWNWDGYEGTPLTVTAYSSCERVELFLNGKSLGSRTTNRESRFMATWSVPYQAGTLKVVGYSGKKSVTTAELKTAGEPARIRLTPDRSELKADQADLCYVTVELTDANGVRHPGADNLVQFEVEGPATLIATGNANPVSLESYTLPQRRAWQGRCLAIIKTTGNPGKIVVRASVNGVGTGEVEVISK
jgi:beta-galactosidase